MLNVTKLLAFFFFYFFLFSWNYLNATMQRTVQLSDYRKLNGNWTWTLFYSTFPVFWQLRATTLAPFSHSHIRSHTDGRGARCLIRSNLGCSILLKYTLTCSWGSQGMEPATYRLLDSLLYHLSHSNPYVMVTLCHKLLILILSKLLCLNYNLMAFEAHTDKC